MNSDWGGLETRDSDEDTGSTERLQLLPTGHGKGPGGGERDRAGQPDLALPGCSDSHARHPLPGMYPVRSGPSGPAPPQHHRHPGHHRQVIPPVPTGQPLLFSVCRYMVCNAEPCARLSDDTRLFCIRVMVGCIILYDHVDEHGAFVR